MNLIKNISKKGDISKKGEQGRGLPLKLFDEITMFYWKILFVKNFNQYQNLWKWLLLKIMCFLSNLFWHCARGRCYAVPCVKIMWIKYNKSKMETTLIVGTEMNIFVIRMYRCSLSDSDHTYQDWWLWLEQMHIEVVLNRFAKPFDKIVLGVIWTSRVWS